MKITSVWLKSENACSEASKRFAKEIPDGIELSKLIAKMDRADWLLWLLWHSESVTIRQLVWLACKCGRLSLRHVPKGEDRPRLAYEAAEAWIADPTDAAARAAGAAGDAAWAAWAAGDAAWAAAGDAAWAAAEAAGAAVWAAGAAGAAVWAAGAAAWAAGAARDAEHKKMCALIRAELQKASFRRLA